MMTEVVRYVGKRACRDLEYQDHLKNGKAVLVDMLSATRNVTVQFWRDGSLLYVPMAPESRDLLDLAVNVYIADEITKREDKQNCWTRRFHFTVPVRDTDRWANARKGLMKTLGFLTQDSFGFSFPERGNLPRGVKHRNQVPHDFDAVCLFSGGIDSLLGAYALLSEGRKVLLVGHQAEPVTASAQKEISLRLCERFPGRATLIQCRVARAKTKEPAYELPAKVEDSHRPRSFLFLALAVTVAKAAKVSEIFIPENGLIALNPPLQVSRVGSHSTRTAHPIFLTRLLDTLMAGGIYSGEIHNPLLYESKTDLLRDLDPFLIPLIKRSVSCSHPSRYQDEGVRHCGYCVPCLYRRAAMMVPGIDRSEDYAFDVFRTQRSLRQKRELTEYAQSDARAMVPFAIRVLNSSEAELEMILLSHGYFPPEVGGRIGPRRTTTYSDWTEMLRRWATDFLVEVPKRCTRSQARVFGLNGLEAEI